MQDDQTVPNQTGRCMCGVVSFTATLTRHQASICNCGMCRRWTGAALVAVQTRDIDWQGAEQITTFTSSKWAERGFCSVCGTGLFYRITMAGPYQGSTSVPLGLLDEPNGFELGPEYFIDRKPDSFAFVGERETMTEAEVFAMFAPPES
jgi:hypothetical protein